MAEVGLQAIDREYQTKKLNYDNLLAQQQKIDVGADAAKDFQGGGIQVVDPATCRNVRWRRNVSLWTAAGFGIGMALVFCSLSCRAATTIHDQTTEDRSTTRV